MNKFKVGDSVICIDNTASVNPVTGSYDLVIGKAYTITKMEDNSLGKDSFIFYQVKGCDEWHLEKRFRPCTRLEKVKKILLCQ